MFLGGIEADHIVAVVPVVYPNLSKPFEAGYHDIWGLMITDSPGKPVNFFSNARSHFKSKSGRINLYNPGITPQGKILMAGYVEFALKLASSLAVQRNKWLCYLSADGSLHDYPTGYIRGGTFLSRAQLDIRAPIDPLSEERLYENRTLAA